MPRVLPGSLSITTFRLKQAFERKARPVKENSKLGLIYRVKNYLFLGLILSVALEIDGADKLDWKPVDPALLTLKTPTVEKDAGAEALFWEVYVEDKENHTDLLHYIRVKIFNEHGQESQSKIELAYVGKNKIEDVVGRTIKPNGTISELKKDAIFDRVVASSRRLKVQTKSFAMPGVEPGSIVEYRWREVCHKSNAYVLQLYFQRDIPIQQIKYYIKHPSDPELLRRMQVLTFNAPNTPLVREDNHFSSLTMTNVPAFHKEPEMPPEDQVRPWMLLYYVDPFYSTSTFWRETSKAVYERNKSKMKVDKEIRKVALETIAEAATHEQKLERLYDFCRTKVKNVNGDALVLDVHERNKLKENKSPSDTLKQGVGTGHDISILFSSLANAVGFDARLALLGDRSSLLSNRNLPFVTSLIYMNSYNVAVRVGDQWRFFDPAGTYIPNGMLRWQEEAMDALVSDPNREIFVRTPLSPPEKSNKRRTARLRLNEDGVIEGEVSVEHTGHCAIASKEYYDDMSPAEREKELSDVVKEYMTTAELSNIHMDNVTDPLKPFTYSYNIRIPGYAQRTGKRLFLQPGIFQRGQTPRFPSNDRKYDICFQFPWTEFDDVRIELPPGFALDNAEAPGKVSAGKDCTYSVTMTITSDGQRLSYKRSFMFGGNGTVQIPVSQYPALKKIFDVVHENDNRTIVLKQSPVAPK